MLHGKIKIGTRIGQDFRVARWPNCFPPEKDQEVNPDMLFEITWTGRWWDCRRDGYGRWIDGSGSYGNGSIFVFDKDGVEIIDG